MSKSQTCQVCGALNSHGKHFDVFCCRACAVFFRRRAGTKYVEMPCKSVHCDRKMYFCKPCRLKRCYEVGMNVDKFQYNRDVQRHQRPKIPQSFASFVGRPELVLICTPNTKHAKTFVDLKPLIQETSRILRSGPDTPFVRNGTSQLKKLTMGFNLLSGQPNFEISDSFTKFTSARIWEYYLIRITKWLTFFDEFQTIPDGMKLQLVLSVWHVFGRLDKLAATARFRRLKKIDDEKCMAMSDGTVLHIEKTRADFSWMSPYPFHQVIYFLNSIAALDLIHCVQKLIDLEVSDVELTWMLAQLSFEYAGKRFQGDVLKMCDKFQKVLADDLHEYYVREMRMTRYFGRLSQLMKINNAIQKDIFTSRARAELAVLFNVFTVEFSHPEMFRDTGFC